MKRKNTTRSALFTSIISLLLCVSMLVGTTFAWFTDTVESGKNVIAAGNLDVELEYAKVVNGQITSWNTVAGEDDIFDPDALWEPGRVEVVYLKVSNLGTLALKYQLGVNVVSETPGVSVKTNAEFKLSDYLVFKVVDMADAMTTYTDREAVQLAAGTEMGLKDYNGTTKSLDPKDGTNDEDYVALIVYMPETVGNEANYKTGTTAPSIELGVNLYATQVEAEDDSFGPDYDENAWHPDMVVTSASELAAAIENVKDGGTIALVENLTFDKDSSAVLNGYYEGLYYEGDKSFTIDLNGKTITNDSAVNDYLMLFKNNGEKASTITFKNGTIEAGSTAYSAICTSSTSTQQITINLENVKVTGNNGGGSVVKIRGGAVLNVNAGTVITGNDSYLGIESLASTVNIYDGAEIYQNGTSSYNGCLVGVGGNGTVNVYGGYGKGVKGGFIAMTSGGTINVSGGEWIANTDGTPANGNNSVLIAQNDKNTAGKSVVNVTGGTFFGGYNCYGNAADDAQINISAGTFNADPSAYVTEDYKAVNVDGVYHIVPGTTVDADLYILNVDQLVNFATDVNSGNTYKGKTVALLNDIDLAGVAWTPINNFEGTFNGNGHTISNLTVVADKHAGMFGYLANSGATITNLTIDGANINANTVDTDSYAGAVLGYHYSSGGKLTISDVTVTNSTVTGKNGGAVVGSASMVTISACASENNTINASRNGGIIGTTLETSTVMDCTASGNTQNVQLFESESAVYIGTIVARISATSTIQSDNVTETRKIAAVSEGTTIADAIENGASILNVEAGNYDLPSVSNGDVTISGSKDVVITINTPAYHGSNVTMNGVTIAAQGTFTGVQHVNNATYNDVTINGEMCLYGEKVVFNNCTFNLTYGAYLRVYGAKVAEFNNCTFNTEGHAILVFQDGTQVAQTVKVEGCTFNASQKGYNYNKTLHISAVSCDGSQGGTYNVILNNNTVDEDFNGLWQDKTAAGNITVTVDGETVLKP